MYCVPPEFHSHQYAREMLAAGGKMILGSDSHTRYGALGTMAMGEGGPELVKQLLRTGQAVHMVVLIDGSAYGAEAVVAVGQHIRDGKTLQA